MVNLLFIPDDKLLTTAGTVREVLDRACGAGGIAAAVTGQLDIESAA